MKRKPKLRWEWSVQFNAWFLTDDIILKESVCMSNAFARLITGRRIPKLPKKAKK